MRVIMLTRFRYWSAAGHVISLAAALNRQGIKTAVIFAHCPPRARKLYSDYCRLKTPLFFADTEAEIGLLLNRFQPELLHLHGPELLPAAYHLARQQRIPYGVTIHHPLSAATGTDYLAGAAFLIKPTVAPAFSNPVESGGAVSIPEGIDLDEFKPAPREGFRVTCIAEEGFSNTDALPALLKAAGIIDLDLEIISPQILPPHGKVRYHGWLPGSAALLKKSQVVIGRGRSLLEGLACGNAALILGERYGGIVEPAAGLPLPDLSGRSGAEPCYRDLFYDLSRLWKERDYLRHLQQWGRRHVRENFDLRLTAEMTARLYLKLSKVDQGDGPGQSLFI